MDQLVEYARHGAAMEERAEDGASTREHLKVAARRRGAAGDVARAALHAPPFPSALAYLWGWFQELASQRQYDERGPRALRYVDVDAWARLTDRHPEPREVLALFTLDHATRFPHAAEGT